MQAIDVLGDEQVEPSGTLQVDERAVTGIRARAPRGMLGAALPGFAPDARIGDVVADVAEPLGSRVPRPDPVGSTKVRNARLGADPGPGEDNDRSGRGEPAGNVVDGAHSSSQRWSVAMYASNRSR